MHLILVGYMEGWFGSFWFGRFSKNLWFGSANTRFGRPLILLFLWYQSPVYKDTGELFDH
jgi:hypothetical protein